MACLTAIVAWVAIIMIGAYVWPGGEAGGRYAFVTYGAVFCPSLMCPDQELG